MNIVDRARALTRTRPIPVTWPPHDLSLALQGGGSFGAFTWGVLDRLLDERRIRFDVLSGASAGAVNATLLASGLIEGGRAEAQARLERFWRRMSAASFLPLNGFRAIPGAGDSGLGLMTRVLAPYQFNPFDLNPLREALAEEIDFVHLAARASVRLLIATTRVSDGQLRIFRNSEMSLDAVLASTCLPLLHRSIEIDGEAYWDGGYAANPPLVPLAHETKALDILIVQLTPMKTDRMPVSARDIAKRIDQITFNATLNAQVEALKLGGEIGATPKLRTLRIGRIAAENEIEDLAQMSATDLALSFLLRLRDSGRKAADDWLTQPRGLATIAN